MKNLYEILGVSCDSSAEEIKTAYKKLANKHHPDKNPDDPKAKTIFQSIREAYEILSNPQKRKRYDKTGQIDDTLSTTEMAAKLIFDLYIYNSEKNNFKSEDYFKIVRKDLMVTLESCKSDIEKVNFKITRLQYLIENTLTNGLLDKLFETKMLSFKQTKAICEHGKEIIEEAIEILDQKCKYKGEDSEQEKQQKIITFLDLNRF